MRVNLGAGASPTPGWLNFDNSPSVRLYRVPGLIAILAKVKILTTHQREYAKIARNQNVRWANAVRRIPLPSGSVEVVYTSHMIEHLDPRSEVPMFLEEVRRVLRPGGILRVAVPDLLRSARRYVQETHDADDFINSLLMADQTPRHFFPLLQQALVGSRGHRWMYDARSLIQLLETNGFSSVREVSAGQTMIPDPGELNLREREDESTYVEARLGAVSPT